MGFFSSRYTSPPYNPCVQHCSPLAMAELCKWNQATISLSPCSTTCVWNYFLKNNHDYCSFSSAVPQIQTLVFPLDKYQFENLWMQTKQNKEHVGKKHTVSEWTEWIQTKSGIGELVNKLKDKKLKIEKGWRGTMEDKMTLGLIEIEATIPAM